MRFRLLALAFISALLLAGCGVRGSLKTPPPLWGASDKAPVKSAEPAPTPTEPKDIEDDEDDNYLEGPY